MLREKVVQIRQIFEGRGAPVGTVSTWANVGNVVKQADGSWKPEKLHPVTPSRSKHPDAAKRAEKQGHVKMLARMLQTKRPWDASDKDAAQDLMKLAGDELDDEMAQEIEDRLVNLHNPKGG